MPKPLIFQNLFKLMIIITCSFSTNMFADEPNSLQRILFSPIDDSVLLTGYKDGRVGIWNMPSGAPLWEVRLDVATESPITALAFSPDGNSVIAGSMNGSLKKFDVFTGEPLGSFQKSELYYTAVQYSTDGNSILTSEDGRRLRIWQVDDFQIQNEINVMLGGTNYLGFSSANSRIYCSGMMAVGVWSTLTGSQIARYQDPNLSGEITLDPTGFLASLIIHVDYTKDLEYVALGMWRRIVILDSETGMQTHRITSDGSMFSKVKFSQDDSQIYAFTTNGQATAFNVLSGTKIKSMKLDGWDDSGSVTFQNGETPVAFSANGKYIAYKDDGQSFGFQFRKFE